MKALAIKYRPKTFDDVVEQSEIKTILQEQLSTDTHKNCYLFTGGAGTGKTTCARIFANELNNGEGNPIEIDAASNNGVESVREIIDGAKFKAIDSRFKIYILDECVTGDTEILTDRGFVRIDTVTMQDKVAQYTDEGFVEFVFPNELVHRRYKGDMYRVSFRNGKSPRSVLMSPHHVQPVRMKQSKKIVERYIKDCVFAQSNEIITAGLGVEDNANDLLTYQDKLFIALQADGYCGKKGLWELHLSIPTKIARAKYLLGMCGVEYKEYNAGDTTSIRFYATFPDSKKFKDYFSIIMGGNKAKAFISELLLWDGSTKSGYPGYYSCTDKDNVDFVAAVLAQAGYAGNQGVALSKNDPHNDIHQINWFYKDTRPSTHCKKTIEQFEGDIYCVKVPSQKIILRANGFTFISGNCHMLSTGAWNAMLKIIEEPPAQTIFIFCTTDPQKIPATILSRVQRYDFRRITFDSVVDRLKYICEQEAKELCDIKGNEFLPGDVMPISYDPNALAYIAKIADGGMRDAITLLDKCVSYSTEVTIENVTTALGTVDYDTFIDLTNAILDCKADKAVLLIEDAYRRGLDLKQFMKQYQLFLLDLAKYCLLGDFKFLQMPDTYADQLKTLADFKFIKYLLGETIKLNNTLKWDTNPKALIEASLIMLCQEG